jgi:hypothetical protein
MPPWSFECISFPFFAISQGFQRKRRKVADLYKTVQSCQLRALGSLFTGESIVETLFIYIYTYIYGIYTVHIHIYVVSDLSQRFVTSAPTWRLCKQNHQQIPLQTYRTDVGKIRKPYKWKPYGTADLLRKCGGASTCRHSEPDQND